MPNIFDGLDKLDDEVIRENIAMLEVVNMGNVLKGYGTTVANKSAKLVNSIGGFFGKNPGLTVTKEKRIDDYIEDKKLELIDLNRGELDFKLYELLNGKTNILDLKSKDVISANIIDSVADYMKLGEYMTVAQKADSIHRRYFEKVLNSMQKKLENQNAYEANKTINEIDKNIENLSYEEKEELKRILNVNNLSGKEIRNVLTKAGTPALIMGALSASGFGAFMALTTIIHAIFTTILGITVPFAVYTGASSALSFVLGPAGIAFVAGTTIWQFTRGNKKLKNEILGQIIFASVNSYGGSFVVPNEALPSHEEDPNLMEEIIKRDEEYKRVVKENIKLQTKVKGLAFRYNNLQKDITQYKNEINREKSRREFSESLIVELRTEKININSKLVKLNEEIANLEKEVSLKDDLALKESLENSKILNENYKRELEELSGNIEYQQTVIEDASNEINEKARLIKEKEEENIELQKENEVFKKEIESKSEKLERTEKLRKKEILEKWNVYYPDFEIKTMAIRDASKFSKAELWEIERALMELHSLSDYRAVSRGKIKEESCEYEHMGLSLPCGFPTRILYKVNSNEVKKVVIEKIYKHNKKIYS